MKSTIKTLMACIVLGTAFSANAATTVTVDPGGTWLGYMNVFDKSAPGYGAAGAGGFQFASGWGTPDLRATFAGPDLSLKANTIGDANPYWYLPSGSKPIFGRFDKDNFRLYKRRYTLRRLSSAPVFHGEMRLSQSGTVVQGHFSEHHYNQAFFTMFFVLSVIGLIIMGTLFATNVFPDDFYIYNRFQLLIIPLWCGLATLVIRGITLWVGKADEEYMLRYLQQTLNAKNIVAPDAELGLIETTRVSFKGQNADPEIEALIRPETNPRDKWLAILAIAWLLLVVFWCAGKILLWW